MSAPAGRILELLDDLLTDDQPANVDRESVTITSYGAGEEIVLIPHRDLGGYSLGLRVSPERMQLVWAAVIDLEYRDDIDVGKWVGTVEGTGGTDDDAVTAAIRAELRRPIAVRVRKTRILRRRWLRCAIEWSGEWIETAVRHVATDMADQVTSLMGPERPQVRFPAPVDRWRKWGDPARPVKPAP